MDVEWGGEGEQMGKNKKREREREREGKKESEVPLRVPQGRLNRSALQVCERGGKHCLSKQRFAQQTQLTRSEVSANSAAGTQPHPSVSTPSYCEHLLCSIIFAY